MAGGGRKAEPGTGMMTPEVTDVSGTACDEKGDRCIYGMEGKNVEVTPIGTPADIIAAGDVEH